MTVATALSTTLQAQPPGIETVLSAKSTVFYYRTPYCSRSPFNPKNMRNLKPSVSSCLRIETTLFRSSHYSWLWHFSLFVVLVKLFTGPPGLSQLAGNWKLNWNGALLILPELLQIHTKSIYCKREAKIKFTLLCVQAAALIIPK